jgi:hypothetical protein
LAVNSTPSGCPPIFTHSRALQLALSSFLDRLRNHLDGAAGDEIELPKGTETYKMLHDRLTPVWSQRTTLSHAWKGVHLAVFVAVAVVYVGNILAGSCVPLFACIETSEESVLRRRVR